MSFQCAKSFKKPFWEPFWIVHPVEYLKVSTHVYIKFDFYDVNFVKAQVVLHYVFKRKKLHSYLLDLAEILLTSSIFFIFILLLIFYFIVQYLYYHQWIRDADSYELLFFQIIVLTKPLLIGLKINSIYFHKT